MIEVNKILLGDNLELMRAMPSKCVDLVIGSPPYAGKGERYGTKWKWGTDDWVTWMLDVTRESLRISRNVVVWIANGHVADGLYHPACEGLIWRAWKLGIRCERPAIWHKNAPPSKRPWFGNDWEFCMAFRPEDSTEFFDWEAIAERFRQRTKNGERRLGSEYPTGKLTRPRDVIRATVGGGHLGSKLAHLNEAPYPEKLIEPFVLTLCPKDGIVMDPFSGSGTSAAVAAKSGRQYIGIDVRESQVDLSNRRIAEAIDTPNEASA